MRCPPLPLQGAGAHPSALGSFLLPRCEQVAGRTHNRCWIRSSSGWTSLFMGSPSNKWSSFQGRWRVPEPWLGRATPARATVAGKDV